MSRTILRVVENVLGRRAFLSKLTTLSGAFLAGVLGFPKAAQAKVSVVCCQLCVLPGSCSYSNCGLEWWWCCCYQGRLKHCMECFEQGTVDCENWFACTGVKCSKARDCEPAPPECPECYCCGDHPDTGCY
jgi:hypothetical protein